jgi:hypothetical protein
MKQGGRVGAMALTLVVAALPFAACGGDGGSSAGSSARDANDSKAARFSQCMRKNGVPDFPDPVNGELVLRVEPGEGGLDPESPRFKSAQEACKSLAPSGPRGAAPDDELQQQSLAFAKCMRSNGVPTFPDPVFSDGGVKTRLPDDVSPDSQAFQNAQRACQSESPMPDGP